MSEMDDFDEMDDMEDEDLFPIDTDEIVDMQAAVDVVEVTLARLIEVASVDNVYGQPVEHGEHLIIPAAEVLAGVGFGVGYGIGGGNGAGAAGDEDEDEDEDVTEDEEEQASQAGGYGGGGGGGGGGRSFSRPVAVIIASPEGVRVEPVVDVTKVALAAFTAFGFMGGMLLRMSRRPRRSGQCC